jgi:transcriptional regulator of acetoin/glycerol metabolism
MRGIPSQMYSDPDMEPVVMRAWEASLQGRLDRTTSAVRDLVDMSWQRCLRARVDPHARSGPHPLPEDVLFLRRERQRDLLEASAPVMSLARSFLSETGTLMALADTDCTILSVEGDGPTIRTAEGIHLMPGVPWSETLCGTNAIGTALAIEQPVQVHSAEHYCEGIKRWTCSATVIRHPFDGKVIGVLDISGLSHTYSRQSLALVVTSAGRIESRLRMMEMERHLRLIDLALPRLAQVGHDGALLYDRLGHLVKANAQAQAALDLVGMHGGLDAVRHVPELALNRLQRDPVHAHLPSWLRPEWLHPLTECGQTLGTLLVLPGRPARRSATAPVASMTPADDPWCAIVGHDDKLKALIERGRGLARSRMPVLLQGETGVGKELFARGLHAGGPFVALNCGSLPRDLLASELFGYADGAFTGARKGGMMGKIEAANGGTLFLDEIGEMPLDMQAHLLRVLEEGEIWRLGENTPRQVRFRLVAATHRDLRGEIQAGRFRMDLYYRIAVASMRIPALRERRGDIALLCRHFLDRLEQAGEIAPTVLAPQALAALQAYHWPGNVRELRNVIESSALQCGGGVIGREHLPAEVLAAETPASGVTMPTTVLSMEQGEVALIRQAIRSCGGNLSQAARALGIAKSTLYAKMQRYGLSRGE